MYLRVLVCLVFLGFLVFLRDFRRVLFAPPPGLGEALGEAFGEALGEVFGEALGEAFGEALGEVRGPRSTFFCNLKSYSSISLLPME